MAYIVLTNNSLVNNKYKNSILVDGDYLDVLYETRRLIYEGYCLITYPLNASIRMIFSPVKSILISNEVGEIHEKSVLIIEDSIEKYKNTLKGNQITITWMTIKLLILNYYYQQ